jgi:hypothetical protein
MKPIYKHDCERCQFVARVSNQGMPDTDWYYCASDISGATIIGRHSNDGPDYYSCPVNMLVNPIYDVAYRPHTKEHVLSADRLIAQQIFARVQTDEYCGGTEFATFNGDARAQAEQEAVNRARAALQAMKEL